MLKEILEKILFENPLCEMAYDRKTLLNEFRNQAFPLYEHILSILAFQQYSEWDQTIKDIINRLIKILLIKQNRKWIKTKENLKKLLFEEPILDDNKKQTNETIKEMTKLLSKEKQLDIRYIPNIDELENIYDKLIDKIWNKKSVDRDNIRKIINIDKP